MGCSRYDNCDTCYKLTETNNCPCVDDLSEAALEKLNSRLGTKYRSNSINVESEKQMMWTEDNLWEDYDDVSVGGDCKPLCCPSFKCTPELCPICYRRNRTDRKTCPCVKFWTNDTFLNTLTAYSISCGNKFFCILWSCFYYLIFISVQMEVGHRSRPNWPDSKYVAIGPWIFVYWLMDRQQGKVIRYSYSQGCIKCPSVGI